ncbi:MAG: hypothetical protein HYZ50_24180 [Deltaproteobacteria bacterium]|nr:hypothetical protein [Deltaproteobacteria bacterium]
MADSDALTTLRARLIALIHQRCLAFESELAQLRDEASTLASKAGLERPAYLRLLLCGFRRHGAYHGRLAEPPLPGLVP